MLKSLAVLTLTVLALNPGKKSCDPNLPDNNCNNQRAPVVSFANDERPCPNALPTQAEPPHWYTSPEWWLCILGIPTLIFIGWQAYATAKSAKAGRDAAEAARDSIRLQESEMQQWVEVRNWRVTVGARPTENSGAQTEIKFDIVNGSSFPLTMNDAHIVFYGHTMFGSGNNVFLAPNSPYLIAVLFPISIPDYKEYESGRLITVKVDGKIPHVGRLGRAIVQSFTGHLIFGRGKEPRFIEEISMVPVEQRTHNRA